MQINDWRKEGGLNREHACYYYCYIVSAELLWINSLLIFYT